MPGYTSNQKQLIAQFVSFASVKDSVAAKFLKGNGWDVARAVDDYFQHNPSPSSQAVSALNKIFDGYRGDIKVNLDEVVCLAISELLRSPSMGEFTRENFVDGWKESGSDTLAKQALHASNLRNRIPTEPALFRRIYRYAFVLCRLPGQRHLTLEIATEQWRLFFTPDNGGIPWNTNTVPWLDWWIEFIENTWKRPVNKDLWEQTEVLMRKTLEDPSLKWWSPDGAWPGAVDDFVVFAKAKLGTSGANGEMDVE
ncbi:conserved hypothetical protein [Uncinocarpus reesii 1704]|uniref:Defective in cullin neddylation protein n=1 Tax=Uncinocarpus reesii (strain UAMH 1704) TaxID=336963 RepID=C4JUU5_UNCRE|nr:uncharacterized protein UREG_04898 [Uncinocarpus reesii 1704]EEP80056.1 conserved hypothetical protein [Uncinocarpus reesii 1704]